MVVGTVHRWFPLRVLDYLLIWNDDTKPCQTQWEWNLLTVGGFSVFVQREQGPTWAFTFKTWLTCHFLWKANPQTEWGVSIAFDYLFWVHTQRCSEAIPSTVLTNMGGLREVSSGVGVENHMLLTTKLEPPVACPCIIPASLGSLSHLKTSVQRSQMEK